MENRTVAMEAASGFLFVIFAYDLLSVIFVSGGFITGRL